jgi:hypothetical protein
LENVLLESLFEFIQLVRLASRLGYQSRYNTM